MKSDNYKKYFTRELMMGPNSIRLLDEIIANNPEAINGGIVPDTGYPAVFVVFAG